MRILQLTKYYPPFMGGIEAVTYDLTEGLNRAGIPCDVLCSNDTSKSVVDVVHGYTVHRAAMLTELFSTSISPVLISKLAAEMNKYDIIHVHFPDPLAAAALLLTRPKAKLVVHWHSDIVKQKLLLKAYRPLQNWVLRRAAAIIGTSEKYIEESDELTPFRHKTRCVPIGTDGPEVQSDAAFSDALKVQYKGHKVVFALGRLVYYKGFEYLIEAARHLGEDVKVIIGGNGPLKEELQAQIRTLKLEDKVVLAGRIDDKQLRSYFELCDVFCFPSVERSEAFGVVQLEAMMCGKPIVATNIPRSGVSWVNKEGVSGYNVAIKDATALAEKINYILADEARYQQLSQKARERYETLFTADKMVQSVIKIYQGL